MGFEATGKLHTIYDTKQVSERFSKREFVLELTDNPKYPQTVLFQLTGDRCAQLDGMQVGWLRSILAHEYGHFRNQDTAGGTFALAARRSMMSLVIRLAESGTAGWFNPAWWFARAYLAVFLRVSLGASRLQEIGRAHV